MAVSSVSFACANYHVGGVIRGPSNYFSVFAARAFLTSAVNARSTLLFVPFLVIIAYPPFSHHELGRDFPPVTSTLKERCLAASPISSSRGACIAKAFGTFLPSIRDFVESRLAGQTIILPGVFNRFDQTRRREYGYLTIFLFLGEGQRLRSHVGLVWT